MFYNLKKSLLSVSIIAAGIFLSNNLFAQCPAITCPSNITVNNDPGTCGASVTYLAPVGTTTCVGQSVSTIQISGLTSGSTFPVGTQANTFRVTESPSGNTTQCTFFVTVNDNVSPAITGCPSNISTLATAGTCSASAAWSAPGANDNCTVSSFTATATSGQSFNVGATVVTYTARDLANNSSVCSFTVTVNDDQNPVISGCPANIAVNTTSVSCTAVATWTVPGNSDNCSVSSFSGTHTSGSTFNKGVTAVSYTAIDPSGNSAVCSFNVTVTDNVDPVITCPSNISVNTDLNICSTVVTYAGTHSDNCGGETISQTSGLASGAAFPKGQTTNTWKVTDLVGNTSFCSFTVTVTDAQSPTFTTCPANITVNTTSVSCAASVSYTVTPFDNCSGFSSGMTAGSIASGGSFPKGTTVNTYTITDAAGNTGSNCTFTVTVNDVTNPEITCPSNISVNNTTNQCNAVVTYTTPVGTDNCPGMTTAQIAGLPSGGTYSVGATVNTFRVTDASAGTLTATCSFTVTVNDNQDPAITCPGNISQNVDAGQCSASVFYSTPSGTDNCPGQSTLQIAGLPTSSTFSVGTTVNTYKVTDAAGNTKSCSFNVIVTDNINPSVSCPSNITTNMTAGLCTAVVTYSVTASDNCSPIFGQSLGLPSGSAFPKGNTVNTYTVTDAAGNTAASCSFTVTVIDNQNPAITCPSNINQNTAAGVCTAVVNYTAPIGTDNCTGQTTSQTAGLGSGATYPLGMTVNTFQVTDAALGTASCSFTVTIVDAQTPAISCPGNISKNVDAGQCTAVTTYNTPVGTDNCSSPTTIQTSGNASGFAFPTGVTLNTFKVTDGSSNSAVCSFSVTVTDNINPAISCPANSTQTVIPGTCSGPVAYTTPSGTDNCPGQTTFQSSGLSSGSFFNVGTTINTFVVTDASGNTASCTFLVTMVDNVAPTISGCPSNISLNNAPGFCDNTASWTVPTANDNCLMASFTSTHNPGATFAVGTTVVSYTATDNSGNTAICSFSVTITDNQNPVLVCPSNITVNTDPNLCTAVVNFTAPIGTDNCTVGTVQTAGFASGTAFPKGTTIQTFKATDVPQGNTAICSFNITVNDIQLPAISCPVDISVNAAPAACTQTVAYTAPVGTDNCPGQTTAQIAGSPSGSIYNVGSVVNTFRVTDASGNTAVCSFSVTVIDNQLPVINCPSPITVNVDPGLCTAIVTYATPSGTDNCVGQTTTQTAGQASGTAFPKGTTTNTFKVTDASNNTALCSFNVTVNDNINPTIGCPANISVNTDPNLCTAVVNFIITNSDNCPGQVVSLVSGQNSGSAFPKGSTLNTFMVTDASNNTATCSFSVTVTDAQNPTITCPANITKNTDPTACTAVTTYSVSFGDNCTGSTLAQTAGLASGAAFPKGATLNTYKVTDAVGNTAVCSFSVTVNDTENPAISCPAPISVNAAAGVCTQTVSYTTPAGTDNCAGQTTAQTAGLASGATYPLGTTLNTYKVTDASGNTAICSFSVTVIDNQNPVIVCPANISVSAAAGLCSQVVTYTVPVGTDNCSGQSTTQTAGLGSGATYSVGVTLNTFKVTDGSNNTASCSFSVTVTDNENPGITCPANIAVNTDLGLCTAVVSFTVSSTDNCAGQTVSLVSGMNSGAAFPKGVTNNTFKATDLAGNTAVCSFSVTVTDNELPTITCPADITKNNDPGNCSAFATFANAVGLDNCPGQTTIQISGMASGSSFPVGTTNNLWEVTDAVGLKKQCLLKVTVVDVQNPVITSCPGNITKNSDPGVCTAVATWSNPTATDNCAAVTFTNNFNSGATFSSGVTAVNYVATDNAGNSALCTFSVTVVDNQNPTVTCPANISVNTTASLCSAVVTYTVGVSDNCPSPVLSMTAGLASGSTFPKGATLNTFMVTDAAGNTSASCSFSVTVTDAENPTVSCPANIAANTAAGQCSAIVTYAIGTGDNCPGQSFSQSAGLATGATFPKGITVNTFMATDASGNTSAPCSFTVTVTDNQAPTIVSCPANTTISTGVGTCDNTYSWSAPTVLDNCSGMIIQTGGSASGSTFPKGTSNITYTASDAAGNSTLCNFSITVVDILNPSISCPANISVPADPGQCTALVTYATPGFTDNCPGANVAQNVGLPSGSNFPTGVTTNTFTATDASGNTNKCSFSVTVNETQPPVITCNANIVANTDAGLCSKVVSYAAPIVTDNCSGATFALTAGLASGSAFPKGVTVNTFVATDAAGNSAACSFSVTISDAENPVIAGCPSNASINNNTGICGAVHSWATVTVSDNCPSPSISQTGLTSGSTFPKGISVVTYNALDATGNSAVCTFSVTVIDNELPVVSGCPASTTVSTASGTCDKVYTWASPTVTDNCTGVSISQTAGPVSGSTFPKGVTNITYMAVDGSGNSVACNFSITVIDVQNPSVSCPANISVPNDPGFCTAAVTFAAIVGTDNCPGATVNQTTGLPSGSSFIIGTTLNTFVATDASGNSAVCTFSVTVIDVQPPVINCIANITANTDPGQCSKIVSYVAPVGTGNCPGVTTAQTAGLPSGSVFPKGNTVNTFVATDASGNTASCSFTVTITDAEAPVIACASNIAVNNDPGVCGAIVTFTVPVGTDNCPGVNTVQSAGLLSGATYSVGATLQTYVATDAAGNSTACSFSVTVTDNELPVITLCQPNITTNAASGVCGNNAFWPTPTFTDNCSGGTVTQTAGLISGSTFAVGVHPISYNVVDANGNSAVCSFTVTIIDSEKPSIACLSNISVANDPGFCSAVVTFATMNVTDNCPGAVLTQIGGIASGGNFPAGVTQNVFIATDASLNVDTCKFQVSVIESTAPTITCPANIAGTNDLNQCGKVVSFTAPVGLDNCSGATTALTVGQASGSSFPVGVTLNTYVVTDASGNSAACSFSVTITDTQLPVISCASSISQPNDAGLCGAVVTYSPISGTDNCTGASTTQTAGLASAALFPVGTTVNTYKVTDAAGNTAICSFNVTVTDVQAPVISCGSNIVKGNDAGQCTAVVTFTATSATDNCSGTTTVQTAGFGSGSIFPVGTTVNSFKATDAAGNSSVCSFSVTITDTELPVISCGSNITLGNTTGQCAAVVSYTAINGTDNCTGAVTTQTAGLASGTSFSVGTTVNTYKVTDVAGNSAVCSFSVTITDSELPMIACGSNITLANTTGQCSAVGTYAPVVATDNCTGVTTTQTAGLASAATFTVGTTVNTFVATDAAGNTSTCSFNIIVVDAEKPTIVCGGNITISANSASCSAVVTFAAATGSDNCSGVVVTQSAGLASGATFPVDTTVVTFVVTDASGNKDSCSFNVIVVPVQAVASFTASPAFTTVTFTNTSTGATGYSWDFGDGDTSSLANPVHSYTAAGTYTICLTAFNGCDTTTVCDTLTVIPDGIVVHGSNASVNAYPNPTMNIVNLEVMDNATRTYTVRMVNFVGQEVYSDMYEVAAYDKSVKTIDLTNSPAGMYVITITSLDGKVRMNIPVIRN